MEVGDNHSDDATVGLRPRVCVEIANIMYLSITNSIEDSCFLSIFLEYIVLAELKLELDLLYILV